jgi:RecA-family ATPase
MKKPEVQTPQDFNAAELINMDIPEPKWAVSGILPEGLTLLAGKPKRGKSMMALNLAIAITNGGLALGTYEAVKGPVIYLALEDTKRRLQKRLKKMLSYGGEASNNLIFYNEFPRMAQGGIEHLEKVIQYNPGIRLVIIDTLGKFRPPKVRDIDQYSYDYEVGSALKAIADKHEVSILAVHHMRKMQSEDKFDDVIGSFGVTGSADGVMLLIRKTGQADAELHITGRDVEEAEFAMTFETAYLSWNVIGSSNQIAKTVKQQQVLSVILSSDYPMKPKEVAEVIGLDTQYVRVTLNRLVKQGLISKAEYGCYEANKI